MYQNMTKLSKKGNCTCLTNLKDLKDLNNIVTLRTSRQSSWSKSVIGGAAAVALVSPRNKPRRTTLFRKYCRNVQWFGGAWQRQISVSSALQILLN